MGADTQRHREETRGDSWRGEENISSASLRERESAEGKRTMTIQSAAGERGGEK